jgi:hypothetical protein
MVSRLAVLAISFDHPHVFARDSGGVSAAVMLLKC